MVEDLVVFSKPDLVEIVQNLRNLLSQSSIGFILGAGCSKIAGLPLMDELTFEILNNEELNQNTKDILVEVSKAFEGANKATIEDYMSEIVDFLSIAQRRLNRGANEANIILGELEKSESDLHEALNDIRRVISDSIHKQVNISYHRKFVQAIHNSLQAGKRERGVDYFILNYDTLIEDALGLEQVTYFDGFIGGATGWWDSTIFPRKGESSRVFKLHGSIDWRLLEGDSLPRRIRKEIKSISEADHVLIYPSATKYQESQRDPFAQLLTFFRKSLYPNEKQEMVLTICGYSFGDSHIDIEVKNALQQSEGRLTVVAFCSTNEPYDVVQKWLEDPLISEQVHAYTNRGYFHGSNSSEYEFDIPWWKFEILSRLLVGER